MNKVSERTCVACRKLVDKKQLLRVVRNNEGKVFVDLTGKQNGRGAYVCKTIECIAKCQKTKVLERNLDAKISDEIYAELKKYVEAKK